MLRSFSYAAWAGLQQFTTRGPEGFARLEPWAALWERDVSAAFLREYLSAAGGAACLPTDPDVRDLVVDAYMLDKAFYELQYELDNRRAWVWIPLRGLLSLEGVAR
jgi:maltose alpha-D-glucosyltransferase/alpha-amylase